MYSVKCKSNKILSHIFIILIQVLITFIFLTIFFFKYIIIVEKEEFEKQLHFIVDIIYNDLVEYNNNTLFTKIIKNEVNNEINEEVNKKIQNRLDSIIKTNNNNFQKKVDVIIDNIYNNLNNDNIYNNLNNDNLNNDNLNPKIVGSINLDPSLRSKARKVFYKVIMNSILDFSMTDPIIVNKDIIKSNKKIKEQSYNLLFKLIALISISVIMLYFIGHFCIDVKSYIKNGLIMTFFIAIVELGFLTFISSKYIITDPNKVRKHICSAIHDYVNNRK